MSKLEPLKQKLAALKASVEIKLDKITFLKRWRSQAKAIPVETTESSAPSQFSLTEAYREGGLSTRIQVIFVYVFAIAALLSTFQAGKKILTRLSSSQENEKLKQSYTDGLNNLNAKVIEKANMVSLGKFTTAAFSDGKDGNFMALDVWIKVSDPLTADFSQKNELLLHDRVVEALNNLREEKIDPLTEPGNSLMKQKIMGSLNKIIPHGKVEDVYFHNLILQKN